MTSVPGKSYQGALPPLTAEERALATTLKRHIETIAAREHNIAHYDELEKVARYLEATLASYGYTAGRQEYVVGGKTVRNIDAVIEPQPGIADPEVIVVGAHYDSAEDAPGANDNASGTAAVLELARLLKDLQGQTRKRIRLVLFVNEEPPYFMTKDMGSLRYAKALAARKERVTAMFSLETLGYYSDAPGSQKYPFPFGLMFPDTGRLRRVRRADQFAPAGAARRCGRSARTRRFRRSAASAPGIIPGIGWSDHWAFGQYGFQGVMVTDTAPFRYPHYHEPTDTPDKIDTDAARARRQGRWSACVRGPRALTRGSRAKVFGPARRTGHRLRRAGGGRKGQRQPLQRAHRQEREGLRLERVGRPADLIGGLDGRGSEPLGQHPQQGRIARAAAGDDPCGGRTRQDRARTRDRRGGQRGQRRGAILGALVRKRGMRRDPLAEVVAVERFRRRQREERMQQQPRDRRLVDAPGRGGASLLVARRAGALAHEIVDQRVGRAGVAGDRIRCHQ